MKGLLHGYMLIGLLWGFSGEAMSGDIDGLKTASTNPESQTITFKMVDGVVLVADNQSQLIYNKQAGWLYL